MPGVLQLTVLDTIHRTCKEVVELDPDIKIDKHAVQSYVQQLDVAAVRAVGSRASIFPIKFDSLEAEVNFLCLFHLLDFGSGYDALLRASSSRRGAAETIQYGCFGLALSAARLDGAWMRTFSAYHVHTAFGIESKVEEELQPGITISKPGPLAPLSAAIQSVIVDTGNVLGNLGVKSLGAFVLEHLDGLKAAGKPITAASLVQELADAFPGFQDSGLYTPAAAAAGAVDPAAEQQQQQQPITVLYLRKAQSLVADLGSRFGGEDERFRWTDADKLSADSGALLPAVLRHLGIISCSQELAAMLDSQQQQQQQQQGLLIGNSERAIRAAAVAAVDEIVTAAAAVSSAGFTAREFSNYLLSLVKEGDGQQQQQQQSFQGIALNPHRTVGTLAY